MAAHPSVLEHYEHMKRVYKPGVGLATQQEAFYKGDKSKLICGDDAQDLQVELVDGRMQSKKYKYINDDTVIFLVVTSSVCSAHAGVYGRRSFEGLDIKKVTRQYAGNVKGDFRSYKTQGEHELLPTQDSLSAHRISVPTADGAFFENRVVNTSAGSNGVSIATIQWFYNFISKQENIPGLTLRQFRCENVTVSGALRKQIDIKAILASDHEFTSSKKFPAIKRTKPGISLTILLFTKGRLIVIGSADVGLIFELINDTIRIIQPYFIMEKDAVVGITDIDAIYKTYTENHTAL